MDISNQTLLQLYGISAILFMVGYILGVIFLVPTKRSLNAWLNPLLVLLFSAFWPLALCVTIVFFILVGCMVGYEKLIDWIAKKRNLP